MSDVSELLLEAKQLAGSGEPANPRLAAARITRAPGSAIVELEMHSEGRLWRAEAPKVRP